MSQAAVNGGGLRVLVVDDNRDAAESLAMLVELWGHTAHVSYDATSALEGACSFRPHVVLLDIGLPRVNGFQLAQQIRQQAMHGAILIAVTGYADTAHRSQWESAFDHYLVKPAPVDEVERLLATIKNALHLPSHDTLDTISASNTLCPRRETGIPAPVQPGLAEAFNI